MRTSLRSVVVAVALTSALAWAQSPAQALTAPPWPEPSGRGVALSYASGSWAGQWAQEVRLKVPFLTFLATQVGAVYVNDAPARTTNVGGRALLTGSTVVFLNLLRLYGGGGVELFASFGADAPARLAVGGGGFFGFEFFLHHRLSFFLEVGGRGGQTLTGATITAGLSVFPF